MTSRRLFATFTAILLIGLSTSPCFAWNSTGHEIVALIAFDHLSPAAKTAMINILNKHPRKMEDLLHDTSRLPDDGEAMFVRAATWPDMIRYPTNPMNRTEHHGPWHYVDFPYDSDGIQGPEPVTKWDGHSEPANLAQAYQKVTSELKDPKTTPDRKAIDLCWVEHLVGDIHQPLHAVSWYSKQFPTGDKGGNSDEIRGNDNLPMNLHFYWDSAAGLSLDPAVIRKTADQIEAKHPPDKLDKEIKDLDLLDWAHESFEIAKTDVYLDGKLPHVTAHEGLNSPNSVPPLPPGYDLRTADVADLRIAEAGYRLAAVLEEIAKSQ